MYGNSGKNKKLNEPEKAENAMMWIEVSELFLDTTSWSDKNYNELGK